METNRMDGKISTKWSVVTQRGISIESSESRYETLEILYPTASSFYQEVATPEVVHTSSASNGSKTENHTGNSSSHKSTHREIAASAPVVPEVHHNSTDSKEKLGAQSSLAAAVQ